MGLHRQPVYPRKQPCINQLLCQLSYEGIIYVKMDKLYLHFTQCFPLDYHQQHRIGCFLTLLSTTLLVVTLPPLTRFIFILICTWIGLSYVTPRTTFLPFFNNNTNTFHYRVSVLLIKYLHYNFHNRSRKQKVIFHTAI